MSEFETNNSYSSVPDKRTEAPIVIGGPDRPIAPVAVSEKKKKKKGNGLKIAALILGCAVLSAACGFGGAFLAHRMNEKDLPIARAADTTAEGTAPVIRHATVDRTGEEESENAVIAAIDRVFDSNVEISTETVATNSFFGQYITGGAGSGVVISEDGYIVTCAHVIDGADTVTVTLTDKKQYPATVIGSDSQTDIAVLKIEAEGLVAAVIGDSDSLVVGQTTIAVGNPLGELGGTVTNGIVSALERDVEIDGTTYNLLQTNAAISPGNSGGGLYDINGLLIGIVNAKSSGSGVEGLGFAIPINTAEEVARQLIEFGYIKGRPQLGITVCEVRSSNDYWNVRQQMPQLVSYITDYGVYVTSFTEGAGEFAFGDRIVAVDGTMVSSLSDIKAVLAEYGVGDTVEITVSRLNDRNQAKTVNFNVTLSEYSPAAETAASAEVPDETDVPERTPFEEQLPEEDAPIDNWSSDIFGDLWDNFPFFGW